MVLSLLRNFCLQDSRESYSIGAGIHVIQLLVLGSFIGDVEALHPKIINDLCGNLIKQVLLYAPAGMIPGNYVDLRSFDCYTERLEVLTLDEDHMSTESFLRPYDVSFAESGNISYCKNIGNFAPEDVLHMGGLCDISRRIGCKVYEIPATAEVSYFIRPKKAYCVHNPLTGSIGFIVFDGKSIIMDCLSDGDDGACFSLSLLNWQEEMKKEGFIMLPMVWRAGACVTMDANTIGCLVPPEKHEEIAYDGNFCTEGLEYRALVRRGVQEKISVMQMMQTLLAVGHRLYLKMESHSAAIVRRRLIVDIRSNELSSYALQVHLSTPNNLTPEPGKVFVVCLVCKIVGGVRSVKGSVSEVLIVDPWELIMQPGELKIFKFMSA